MIVDASKETRERKSKLKSNKPIVEQVITSKEFNRLEPDEIHRFIDQHEVIYCVQYMEDRISANKVIRLYLLLFQVAVKSGSNEALKDFFTQYSFEQKIRATELSGLSLPEKAGLKKLGGFLDSHRQEHSYLNQINSLVEQYHEFRIIDSEKGSPFLQELCSLMTEYINSYMPLVVNEIVYEDWTSMGKGAFASFYENYCRVCTLCKRVNYVKCSLMNLDQAEVPSHIREQIEARQLGISKDPQQTPQQIQPEVLYEVGIKREQAATDKPGPKLTISVKKKLKAMNQIISKMEQQA